MSDSRTSILDKLNANTGGEWQPPEAIRPAFVMHTDGLVTLFKQKLESVHASVDLVRSAAEVDDSIANFLRVHNSQMEVGVLHGGDLNSMPSEQGITFYTCEDLAACHTVLTYAPFGIAETGSVVLPSSLQRPTLANFLPDNCIVMLDEVNIKPYMEDALSSVQDSDAGMPRAINLVSGPSKTADIEQTLVYGAHGPIQLHVIVRLT